MNRASRLGVGIIGAGKVGPVLGAALAGAGHALTGITPGSDEERVEAILPGVPVLDALEVVRRSELVVIAVPHDELAGLVSGLADLGAWQPGQLVLHTDPAFGTAVLAPAAARGAIPLAVHPAIAFTGSSMDLRQLANAYAAVTAPAAVLPIAQALAVELGCEPVVIAEADRAAYAEGIAIATRVLALDRRAGRRAAAQRRGAASGVVPVGARPLDARPRARRGRVGGSGTARRSARWTADCPPIASTNDHDDRRRCGPGLAEASAAASGGRGSRSSRRSARCTTDTSTWCIGPRRSPTSSSSRSS